MAKETEFFLSAGPPRKRWFAVTPIVLLLVCRSLFADAVDSDYLLDLDRVRILESPQNISNAVLTNHDGEPFALSQLQGRVSLVFFGFTNCPDVCPITMAKWRSLEASGQVDLSDVAFVLISVDGERDTPLAMKKFLSRFSENFIGLTGTREDVQPIAKQFKAAFFKGQRASHEEHYDVNHSSQAFLLDASLKLRAELYDPPLDSLVRIVQYFLDEVPPDAEVKSN